MTAIELNPNLEGIPPKKLRLGLQIAMIQNTDKLHSIVTYTDAASKNMLLMELVADMLNDVPQILENVEFNTKEND